MQDLGDPTHADAADADEVDGADVERQLSHAAASCRTELDAEWSVPREVSAGAPARWPVPLTRPATRSASRAARADRRPGGRSEEHTSELQSLMRTAYAVCCL